MNKNLNSHDLLIPTESFVFSKAQVARMTREPRSSIQKRIKHLSSLQEEVFPQGTKKLNVSQTRQVTSGFLDKDQGIKHKIHTFYNFKGGTGKTTVCYQLSTMLAFLGYNVLVIDCDPQAHLTSLLGVPEQEGYPTIYDVLINNVALKDVAINVLEGLDIVPSSLALTKIESFLSQRVMRESILSKTLDAQTAQYDYVLIDTNPAFSVLNLNALMACHQLNIVCETHPLSLSGLGLMVEELQRAYKELKKEMNFVVVPNKFEAKTITSQEILGALRKDYKEEAIQTVIKKCEDLNLSTKRRLPVLCFAGKNSVALEDLIDLGHEFIALSTNAKYAISEQESAA